MKFYIASVSGIPRQEMEPIKGANLECEFYSFCYLLPCRLWSIEINNLEELICLASKEKIIVSSPPYKKFSLGRNLFNIEFEHDTLETERVSKELESTARIIIYDGYLE